MDIERGPWPWTKLVPAMNIPPSGYGLVWYEAWSHQAVFAPIPLNVVYNLLHRIRVWFKVGIGIGRTQHALHDAYARGQRDEHDRLHTEMYTKWQLYKAYKQGKSHTIAWAYMRYEIEQRSSR